MPYVKTTTARRASKKDRYYQEWHFSRVQAAINTNEEFIIDVPRPSTSPPAGSYWAIEIHSIEFQIFSLWSIEAAGYNINEACSLGTASRAYNIALAHFLSYCSDPDNLWYYSRDLLIGGTTLGHGSAVMGEDYRQKNRSEYVDNQGHGKLLIGDKLYLQVSSAGHSTGETLQVCFSVEYTWATVSCEEFVGELQSQLSVA